MTTFIFDSKRARAPVELSSWPGHIAVTTRDRIKTSLAAGCYCEHDQPRTATLVQRNGGIWLQCDACGSSLGGAMKRTDFHTPAGYPHWRQGIIDAFETAATRHHEAQPTWDERLKEAKSEKESAYAARSIEYELWCRSSPEWAEIKKRIAWRSRGHCEACLSGNAEVVHHLTYAFGKIPPAWHLRAVCASCHVRLHAGGDDWCDFGMARGS